MVLVSHPPSLVRRRGDNGPPRFVSINQITSDSISFSLSLSLSLSHTHTHTHTQPAEVGHALDYYFHEVLAPAVFLAACPRLADRLFAAVTAAAAGEVW